MSQALERLRAARAALEEDMAKGRTGPRKNHPDWEEVPGKKGKYKLKAKATVEAPTPAAAPTMPPTMAAKLHRELRGHVGGTIPPIHVDRPTVDAAQTAGWLEPFRDGHLRLTTAGVAALDAAGLGVPEAARRRVVAPAATLAAPAAEPPRSEREIGSGRYAFSKDQKCRCGHTLGDHTGDRRKTDGVAEQPCLQGDCDCDRFTPVRRTRRRG